AIEQKLRGEDPVSIFQVVVFAFHQVSAAHILPAMLRTGASGVSINTPSLNVTYLPEIAGTRSPGTTMPARFSGSAAEMVTVSPVSGRFFIARKDSTAI